MKMLFLKTHFSYLHIFFNLNKKLFSIKGEEQHTFHGDRTREEIVNFALRMSGPPVQEITRPESLTNIKNMNYLFFMYVGPYQGPLWEAYFSAAVKLQPFAFFYSGAAEITKNQIDIDELPIIFVYKENTHYFYSGILA